MKITLTSLLLCMALSLMAQSQPLILNKVIANVGGEHVLYSEIQELYSYAKAQSPEYGDNIQCEILEQLISKALLLDQARIDSIIINDLEVEVEVQKRIEYILNQMGGSEERFKDYYGKTPQEQKESMREPLREDMIQQRIQSTLIREVSITPKEVVKFFKQIPEDSLPFLNAEVELGEIAMNVLVSKQNKDAAREKLEKIRDRIVVEKEDFAELASIFSDDPGSARTGGDLGWAKRGSYVPEFEAAAYNLDEGEISEIIETKYGYHLLQLMGRRGNTINVRHILIKPEVTPEDIDSTKKLLDSIAYFVNLDSISFDLAVRLYSDKESQSYNNAGRLINPETGDTFWETGQLPYQIYFAIEPLEVGGLTEILEFEERGEKVFKVIQLKSKSRPHRASLETDYSKIQEFAKESKKNEYFNNWMMNKIKNTYITVAEEFRTCPNLDKYLNPAN